MSASCPDFTLDDMGQLQLAWLVSAVAERLLGALPSFASFTDQDVLAVTAK